MLLKGMIFAAGFGTRLGELGRTTPKCLLEVVDGKRLIDFVLEKFAKIGVTKVVVNTHHLASQVTDYLTALKSPIEIKVVFEEEILETGGGLLAAKGFIEDADHVVLHNGDIFSDFDLKELVASHLQSQALATLLVKNRQSSRGLYFDLQMNLVGHLSEKNNTQNKFFIPGWTGGEVRLLPFSGISIVGRRFFDVLSEFQGKFSITQPFLAAAKNVGAVKGLEDLSGAWFDLGTVEKLEKLRSSLKRGNF